MADRIELGDMAKDALTGFEGVVVADTNWLHGCRRLTLQPRELRDSKPVESQTFDEPQCVLVLKDALVSTRDTGGPRPEPARALAPR